MSELPTWDPQTKEVRRWWCNLCREGGPWYNAGDITVHAGWSVHIRKHEREKAGSDEDR